MKITVGSDWTSGYYEVLLEIDLDGRRRRNRILRGSSRIGAPTAPVLLALSTNTWHF
ncbi:MAG: hypothetical protein R2789_14970 [Microthrixaceae bacterium]